MVGSGRRANKEVGRQRLTSPPERSCWEKLAHRLSTISSSICPCNQARAL